MYAISHDLFNYVYPNMVQEILTLGIEQQCRPDAVAPSTVELHPAIIEIANPRMRLVTSWGRPVNVTFALAEVLWILGGRRDVEMLQFYNSQIEQFSDDGVRFNAAYGHRLRADFGVDQLDDVVRTLSAEPESRQAGFVLWNPVDDKGWYVMGDPDHPSSITRKVTKDRACNMAGHFMIRDGALDLTMFLRSNDALWGVPYNWMQWSHIQEYVAARLGVGVGKYTHVADSLHIYADQLTEAANVQHFDLYTTMGLEHDQMKPIDDKQLNILLREEQAIRTMKGLDENSPHDGQVKCRYWHKVLHMFDAHASYRRGEDMRAAEILMHKVDPIYGAAQARFYHQNRWHAMPEVTDYIRTHHASWVANWITTRVEMAKRG